MHCYGQEERDGEEIPALIECSVSDTRALDAYVDEVSCFIPASGGDVYLQLLASVTSWRYPDQDPEECVPTATGEDVELAWDDEKGVWERRN